MARSEDRARHPKGRRQERYKAKGVDGRLGETPRWWSWVLGSPATSNQKTYWFLYDYTMKRSALDALVLCGDGWEILVVNPR